jgi:tetratricopeptide (TPR) repeat protein
MQVDVEAYRLMRAGRLLEALKLAEQAVAGVRVCVPGHSFLASILLQLGRTRDALEVVDRAAGLGGGGADAYDGLAYVCMALDRHAQANDLYHRAAELSPRTPRHWYNLACSERSFGRLTEAEAACDRVIALDDSQHATYLLRSELRVQTTQANHIEELQTQLAGAGKDAGAVKFLAYALAKELDDVRRFDEAFHWFAAGARACRSQMTYDIAEDERKLRRIAEVYPRDAVAVPRRDSSGRAGDHDGSRDIFIGHREAADELFVLGRDPPRTAGREHPARQPAHLSTAVSRCFEPLFGDAFPFHVRLPGAGALLRRRISGS